MKDSDVTMRLVARDICGEVAHHQRAVIGSIWNKNKNILYL